MKKLIPALALALVLSLFSGALAATVVFTGDTNVRSNPSLNGYKMGAVSQGTWLPYRNVYSVDDRGVMWYGIWYECDEAWVSSMYSYIVYDGEDDSENDTPSVYVHRDSHVRDDPSLDGNSLTIARAGTVLRAGGDSRRDSRGVEWYYVYCNGYWGWISSRNTSMAG